MESGFRPMLARHLDPGQFLLEERCRVGIFFLRELPLTLHNFLGPTLGCLGPFDIDLFGSLSPIGQKYKGIVMKLRETARHCQEFTLARRITHEDFARLQRTDQWDQ